MDNKQKNTQSSEALRQMLQLRYEPIAIKMIEDEAEIPKDAIRPMRDLGKHMAFCQALAMTRRDKKTIYMDKNSEWCWNPLIGFGFAECKEGSESFELISKFLGIANPDDAKKFLAGFPMLPYGKYAGIVTAPLCDCGFEPDLVLIYSGNAQLRHMVWAIKNMTGQLVSTQLDAIDSCMYSCVLPLKTGEYRVTLPDVGEYERAGADEGEIILSVPFGKLDELLTGLRAFNDRGMGYTQLSREMTLDFQRPPFYNDLFRIWGLD
jgi:uncharacterized protein (DUF169 family)